MGNMSKEVYKSKKALPNKTLNEDGTITDLLGNTVISTVAEYENKPALPNKWLNPDGSYSTFADLIGGSVDTELFIVVEELPETGQANKIYLLAKDDGKIIEYTWTNNKWNPIGMVEFDINNYYTKDQITQLISSALTSAKDYADTLFSSIETEPQVFYWDGDTQQAGIAFWQNVVEINKNNDVIVNGKSILNNNSTDKVFTIIKKGKLYNDLVSNGVSNLLFMYQIIREHTKSYSKLVDNISCIQLEDDNREGIITNMAHTSSVYQYDRGMYLDVNYNYSTPYTPQYPGSPATKKYVDDSISNNITNVLGGSY